jgi:hypothetical protein
MMELNSINLIVVIPVFNEEKTISKVKINRFFLLLYGYSNLSYFNLI